MRNPLASTSLREFWARRWNRPTSSVLRSTCYEPILRALVLQSTGMQRSVPRAIPAAASTPAHSTQDANGTSTVVPPANGTTSVLVPGTSGASTTSKATATPAAPAPSDAQSRSRYNLRSRIRAQSASSTAMSTVARNSVATSANSGGDPLASPADVLKSYPVPVESKSPDDESVYKTNGNAVQRRRGGPAGVAAAKAVGSCLAFFVSGAAHHVIIHLLSQTPLHDMRFAMLFWIQPACIALQDAWTGSSWWHSVQCQQPLLAR